MNDTLFEGYWDNNPDNQASDYSWLTQETLIRLAKSHKLSDGTIKIWADTHDKKNRLRGYAKMKELDLGACFMTSDKDYYMYSFKTNRFYFFHRNRDAVANTSSKVFGDNVINAIKSDGIKSLGELKRTLRQYKKGYHV